ncbi:MAG: YebC/PmpR family DNA-binding transcriptional regulator [Acidimicrobiales bacterium]
MVVTTPPSDLNAVRDADAAEVPVESADLAMLPSSTVEISDVGEVRKLMNLMDPLDDLDDVQDVHGNMDVPDEVMDAAQAD